MTTVLLLAMAGASNLQLLGAGCFGVVLGWYVYYVNRYRKGDVQLADLVTLMGVIGGSAVLALFPAKSDLFGAYGVGLFLGYFGYLLVLLFMVWRSDNFNVDWFLDGRRRPPGPGYEYPPDERRQTPMASRDDLGGN
jgi:hypothetical protein